MRFQWSAYLALAESLVSSDLPGGQEASLRSAISRAYYAAFATARQQSRERYSRQMVSSAAEHRDIAAFYALRGDTGGVIAAHLTRLRFLRNRADYDDVIGAPDATAHEAIVRARNVLDLLATL